MKHFTKDRLIGIAFLVFSAVVWVTVQGFPEPVVNSTGDPGPRLFPTLGVLFMGAGSIGLIFQKGARSQPFMKKEEYRRLLWLAVGFLLYTAALFGLGFLVATPVMLFVVMGLMAQGKKLNLVIRLAYSAVITAVLYTLFSNLLRYKLPTGALWRLF